MFESSKDVLNIVIAFSILLFTGFLVWLLYYLIRMLRDTSEVVHEARERIEQIGTMLDSLKEKLDTSATTVAVAAKGISKVVDYVQTRRQSKQSAPERGKKKKKTNDEQ